MKLNLNESEVDILDVVAPQHKKWRQEKRRRELGEDVVTKPAQEASRQPSPPLETEKVHVEIVYR